MNIYLKFLLVFGNEGLGIADDVLELGKEFPGSFILSIEQYGIMRSLSVSCAAGIVMWHAATFHVQQLRSHHQLLLK